jgi:hypothetical protein
MKCPYCGDINHIRHCACGRAITEKTASVCAACTPTEVPPCPVTLPLLPGTDIPDVHFSPWPGGFESGFIYGTE